MCLRSYSVVAFIALVGVAAGAESVCAQSLFFGLGVLKTTYAGSDYKSTSGDWQAEGTIGLHVRAPFRVAVGFSGGKLDEPYSDPSFTTVAVFLEPSISGSLGGKWTGALGARWGWAQERVGEQGDGLWAWGWQAGLAGDLLFMVRSSTGVGLRCTAEYLDLRRDEVTPIPPSGLDRQGWRIGLGLVLAINPS